jgi:Protein of unknown function (DUF3040)
MSLSAWEQQALDSITEGLTDSDPRLAALLATFTRLVSGEEMPAREKAPPGQRRRPRRGKVRQQARRVYLRLGFQRAALLLWLLVTAVLITVGMTLSRSSQGGCTDFWITVSSPSYSSCPIGHGTARQPGTARHPASPSSHRPTYQRSPLG